MKTTIFGALAGLGGLEVAVHALIEGKYGIAIGMLLMAVGASLKGYYAQDAAKKVTPE